MGSGNFSNLFRQDSSNLFDTQVMCALIMGVCFVEE
jgi:hypothetical protein